MALTQSNRQAAKSNMADEHGFLLIVIERTHIEPKDATSGMYQTQVAVGLLHAMSFVVSPWRGSTSFALRDIWSVGVRCRQHAPQLCALPKSCAQVEISLSRPNPADRGPGSNDGSAPGNPATEGVALMASIETNDGRQRHCDGREIPFISQCRSGGKIGQLDRGR